jgi:hypothetical protein
LREDNFKNVGDRQAGSEGERQSPSHCVRESGISRRDTEAYDLFLKGEYEESV